MIVALSPNGGVISSGNEPATTIKAATIRGIFTLTREAPGKPWQIVDRTMDQYQISALLFEPRSGKWFAGTHGGQGLWVSDDGGKTWSELTNDIGHPHVYTIAAQYRGDKTVLFLGVEPVALYRSDDLGQSWTELPAIRDVPGTESWIFPPPPHLAHVKHVAFHPDEPETLYACVEQGALLKTVDDGKTWANVGDFGSYDDKFPNDSHRVVIKPSNPKELFFATGEGLRYSNDGGDSWQELSAREDRVGYPDVLYLDPRNENTVIMAGSGSAPQEWRETKISDAAVIRSTDDGKTWEELDKGLPKPVTGNIEAMGLYHWGDNVLLLAGTATGEIYISEDESRVWSLVADKLPPISKAGHYRWFMTTEQRLEIEDHMRGWKNPAKVVA